LSLRFQADADLKYAIVKAVRQREPSIDFASALESGLEGVSDPDLLDLTARERRILVSHDRRTMLSHFRRRLDTGEFSPGLMLVSQRAQVQGVVEAIVLIWSASNPEDWRDQAHHLPALTRHIFAR
jgi:hypothetical protein